MKRQLECSEAYDAQKPTVQWDLRMDISHLSFLLLVLPLNRFLRPLEVHLVFCVQVCLLRHA